MAKFIRLPKHFYLSKKRLIFLVVASAISLNLVLTCAVLYWHKRDFLGKSILSQSHTAIEFLSRDMAEGNYRRAMEQLSSKNVPMGSQTQSILFYDLAMKEVITSNNETEVLRCREDLDTSYFENSGNNYLVCLPVNSRLLAQIVFQSNWTYFLQTPQFLMIILFNLIFAGVLTLLTLLGMNLYLDRFILLLNKLLGGGTLDQNIPQEFSASFMAIKKLSNALEVLKEKISKNTREAILNDLSQKILHNIRTPLSTLQTVLPMIKEDDSGQSEATAKSATQEIESSITDALENYNNKRTLILSNLYEIVELACHETKIQCADNKKIEILPIKVCAFSRSYAKRIVPLDFKSAIHNILNNAIEAMNATGTIQIEMSKEGEKIKICISDEGTGIDENILPRIGERGFSYGKKNGNGLGLYSLKKDIQSWGGLFKIGNRQGQRGAEAVIIL